MSKASLHILIAVLLFSAHNILVKGLPHLPTVQVVWFRAVISLIICYVSLRQMGLSVWGNHRKLLLLRGVFGTTALFGLFYCLQRLPLAITTIFINLAPIFTVLIAHFILKERARWLQILFLLGAFAGVLVMKGASVDLSWPMLFLGVGVGFVAACAYTCVRMLKNSDHPLVVIFYFPLVTLPIMTLPMLQQWVWPSLRDWVVLLAVGVLTQTAQYFMTMAYQGAPASRVMIFNYSSLIWAWLAGWFLFGESFGLQQMLGLFIIFLCLVGATLTQGTAKPGVS